MQPKMAGQEGIEVSVCPAFARSKETASAGASRLASLSSLDWSIVANADYTCLILPTALPPSSASTTLATARCA